MKKRVPAQSPMPSTHCNDELQLAECVEASEKKVPVIPADVVFPQELCDFLAEVILDLIARKGNGHAA